MLKKPSQNRHQSLEIHRRDRHMSIENTHFGATAIHKLLENCQSIFFIGAGGVNMSSLAHISALRGYRTGGSDRTRTAVTEALEKQGVQIFYEHDAVNVEDYDAVVYTVAISEDNPEYLRARERGIPVISRSDFMGYLMTGYANRVGVSGMHGKSTCTSMCAEVFMSADVDPTVLSGASLASMGGCFRIGGERHFVFEACEYMDSFLDFYPTVAVILNTEMDHVDYFESMEHIYRSFARFAAKTEGKGCALYNADDANTVTAMSRPEAANVRKLGFSVEDSSAPFYAANITVDHGRPSFDVMVEGQWFCHVSLSVTGRHNVYNALAAAAAAYLCGLDGAAVSRGLANFRGAGRRMEYKGRFCGADVYDDYGHHPTEVLKTLASVAEMGYRRVVCVFQPHTYSRTAGLFHEFTEAFLSADITVIADIYAAREPDTGIVSAEKLAAAVKGGRYEGDFEHILEYLRGELREDDVLIIMGAGDIYKMFGLMDFEKGC